MRQFNVQVFDDIVTGTATSWYTSTEFDALLGSADILTLQAIVSMVSGTAPTLTVEAEHSPDGANFILYPSMAWGPTAISNDLSGEVLFGFAEPLLSYARLKVSLGGTSPACRVKLWVTGTSG